MPRVISLAESLDLRRRVLRPTFSLEEVEKQFILEDPGFCVGHHVDESLVCTVTLFPKDHPELGGANCWQLRALAAEESFRGKGIGSQVVAFALEEAKSRGAKNVWLNGRVHARSFYQRLGFRVVDETPFDTPPSGLHFLFHQSFETPRDHSFRSSVPARLPRWPAADIPSAAYLGQDPLPTLRFFRDYGFLIIPQAIPSRLLQDAITSVSTPVERGCTVQKVSGANFHSESSREPAVLRLLSQTTTWDVVTKLLGDDCIEPDVAQVAVKLPEAVSPQPMTAPPSDLHIDGMHTDTSGVPSGQLHNFSLLVGVPLSTVQAQPDGGCLHVLPGSHLAISHALRASPAGVHTLTEADTTVSVAYRLARVIDFSTGRPLPLTVRRGDVYLCHPALAHCVGANGTSEPRVAAYFRVYAGARRTVDGGVQLARHSAVLDPWLEYPSLKQLDSVLSCWSS